VGALAMALDSFTYLNSLYEKSTFIGGGLVIVYQLDIYQRWILHVRYVKGGLKFEDLYYEVVGKAEENWLDNHFEDDDYEDWRIIP
jgi:hypothetical protein